jgi:hypothetical protein
VATPALAALPDRASLPLRSPAPDKVLTGEVASRDLSTCRALPFQVPVGVVRLSVELDYTGKDQHTVLDMGMSDADGSRGWSGSNKASFTLSRTDATPSYLPGAIRAGTWRLNLCISAIRPERRDHYTVKLWFWRHGDIPAVSTFSAAPLATGPRWYRGDLHMHTADSDGACTPASGQGKVPCPLVRTVEAAKARGLDFIAISDHNTGAQFNAMRELQPAFDTLLLIPGVEVTTVQGHANVWGATEPIDWIIRPGRTANAIVHDANALKAPISLNHPSSPTDETCRGCGWSAPDTDYAHVQAIEALNAGELLLPRKPGAAKEPSGVDFWQARLNEGFHLTGVGGSDNHEVELGRFGVGLPTTVVFAENLSERAILDAITAGRVFIDVAGTRDRLLEITAAAGAAKATMGDTLRVKRGEAVAVSIHVAHAKGYRLVVLKDAEPLVVPCMELASDDETGTVHLFGDGQRHWLRVDVVSPTGPILIGNPVWLEP